MILQGNNLCRFSDLEQFIEKLEELNDLQLGPYFR
jgi:hypothetical protein